MTDPVVANSAQKTASPDFAGLVKFLVEPFLESPQSLSVDCEVSPRIGRVLVRLAFEGEDKGRVFGRGGRNIQAIRTVLQAVAQTVGYSAHLDVYGSHSNSREGDTDDKPSPPKSQPRRPPRPRS
ncbi:KH domain-containing protein [Oculatella sp. FACHB-28]|uniref:KH domain-containing protein n=1 Tax=Cyanophyceae TaxID=3028117 RepID=UPI0016851F59|nr:KH domain-containing protein [Oculatella sp. FACHB-28]MBD2068135.1 KH domain-containing protein [Leptolyngbya sp. FACHB-671]